MTNLNNRRPTRKYPLAKILKACCEAFGVHEVDVKSKNRHRDLADCRKAFAMLAWDNTSESTKKVGKFLNRDHSTIIHSRDQGRILFENDRLFKSQYRDAEIYLRASVPPQQVIGWG